MEANSNNRLEAIFDECVESMRRGATLEDCLAAYPEHADELRPLLRTAATVRATYGNVAPAEEARLAGRQRLLQKMQAARRPASSRWFPWGMPLRTWASASALALVLFIGAGFGVVRASGGSVPGEPLYPVKRQVENARLSVPFQSDQAKARLNAGLAAKRAEEIALLARRKDQTHFQSLSGDIQVNLNKLADLSASEKDLGSVKRGGMPAEKREMLRLRLLNIRARLDQDHKGALRRLQSIAGEQPPEAKPKVQQAIDRLNRQYEETIRRIDALLAALESAKSGRPAGPTDQSRPAPRRAGPIAGMWREA